MKKITALCFMMSMLMSHIVSGQEAANDISDKSLKNYKMPPILKQYFDDKYRGQLRDISSTVQETPVGPRGVLHIRGQLRQDGVSAYIGDISDRARAIATAFLKEESAFFGLVDINEIREIQSAIRKGFDGEYIDIYYERHIGGLRYDSSTIIVTIGANQTVDYVSASLTPSPPELYNAVLKETLTEAEIRKIALDDMRATWVGKGFIGNIKSCEKIVIADQPYVVWKLVGSWNYKIDAFSGKILEKTSSIKEFGLSPT